MYDDIPHLVKKSMHFVSRRSICALCNKNGH